MKTDILVRLSYSNIFKQKCTIESLQKKVDTNDSLFVLSTLNKYEYKLREKDNTELQFILKEWLIEENQDIRNRIVAAYAKHSDKDIDGKQLKPNLKTVVIVNRLSTLRVMEVLCASNIDKKKQGEIGISKSRENLLRLYLLVSDEITNRQDKVFQKYFKKQPENLDEIYLHLFLGITQPFQHYYSVRSIQPEVYKFLLFEKWFRNNSLYSELLSDYVKSIGLDNWYQYFNDVFQLCNVAIESNIISFKNYPVLKTLVEHLIIDTSNNPKWTEFVYLRKSPLVKLDEERYAVLDFEFLLNKFFSSLYHDLLFYSKEKGLNKFAQDYVKEFVEGTLLKNAFKTSFGNSYIQLSENEMKSKGSKNIENIGLPDYYFRNGNSVLLFECKNSFISNANKIALNTEKLLRELQDKFYYTSDTKTQKRKSKGILQLLDFTISSINGKYQFFDKTKRPENLNYYPILLVMDSTLTSLGFNQLLNYYFQKELEESSIEKKYKVKPLTIMHIDDFFIHQTRLRKLPKLILSYHRFLKSHKSFDSMVSFSDYLSTFKFPNSHKPRKENVDHIIQDSLLPPE
ncbi:hypothetical protein [uncultured Maribacter sp.]|uniref:hypothetical protein n=1 Tax=uncultured Maribacter sp. TaxID=431308 RepID=UPI00260869F5|nr:hypothetical protein [uncultured Maribacter sp.]